MHLVKVWSAGYGMDLFWVHIIIIPSILPQHFLEVGGAGQFDVVLCLLDIHTIL
jgi:hypothetical protein